MPVIPDPHTPGPGPAGLVWSLPSALAQVTVPIQCGIWWVVVPDRPDLNLEVIVLGPVTSILPGGIKAPASHDFTKLLPQAIHEILDSPTPIVTQALKPKSESQALYAVFLGQERYDAFCKVWELGVTTLLQSDGEFQWFVNLGATRKVSEIQSEDPSFQTMFVVSLDVREVAAV